MDKPRIYTMTFASIYRLYVTKAEKKQRTKTEVNEIIYWLTGHDARTLDLALKDEVTMEAFFCNAPRLNPHRTLITGAICGVRVEEIKQPLMREIRYLDKLIDELAAGKPLDRILRPSS